MEFSEKAFNLRKEIVEDIKEVVKKYGATGEGSLDAYGHEVSENKKVWFVIINSRDGFRFDTGNSSLSYQSEFTIEELANLADQLHQWYNDKNIKK